jgi:hypothetical protein
MDEHGKHGKRQAQRKDAKAQGGNEYIDKVDRFGSALGHNAKRFAPESRTVIDFSVFSVPLRLFDF